MKVRSMLRADIVAIQTPVDDDPDLIVTAK
jgi:hypothetical protein